MFLQNFNRVFWIWIYHDDSVFLVKKTGSQAFTEKLLNIHSVEQNAIA